MQTLLIGDRKRHYQAIPNLSTFKQLDWRKLPLPIKFFQFKMRQLAVIDDM